MGRKSNTRAKDTAVDMDASYQCTSRAWAVIRPYFSARVRARVDKIAEIGGLSLHDIELFELAAYSALDERIKRLERRPKGATALAACLSLQLQSRKHLRTLRLAQSPIGTPNDMRHPEPEAEARRREAHASLAAAVERQEAARARGEIDLGDELIS